MATNLQGSSHRPRAAGFRLRNRKDFIYEDCPDFVSLYESYRHRGMTKGELADRMDEYADLKHDLDFLCKLSGVETSSDIGHK